MPTLFRKAADHHSAGRHTDAEACCRQILTTDPRHPWAALLLARLAVDQKRLRVAEQLLRMAAEESVRAGFADHRSEALSRLGALLAESSRPREAADAFQWAATLSPTDAGARRNLGKALWLAGKLDDAVGAYESAIELAAKQLGTRVQDEALQRNPMPAESLLHNTLAKLYRELISLHHARLDTRSAVRARRAMVEQFPDDLATRSELLVALHYLPEISPREVFDEHLAWGEIAKRLRTRKAPDVPPVPSPAVDRRQPGESLPCFTDESDRLGAAPEPPPVRAPAARGRRIGYFSGNFREYPMTRFLAPVLRGHRRPRECPDEIILYSDTRQPDGVTTLLGELCDAIVDTSAMTDVELDRRLRADQLDLLVDVAGHMDNRRMPVLVGRPARRMASYINYPNTLGVRGWDYRLTDSICDPVGEADELHLEQLIRLDPCAFAYDPAFGLAGELPEPGPLPAAERGCVTFGVLCRPAKIIPETVRLWSAVLAATPGARLAVLQGKGIDRERLLTVLANEGIDPKRVDLLPPGDRRHYLGLHQRIDILLDTWPYNGMTGTCDALWMGVPAVSLQGDRHVSRVGASLLQAAGLQSCVAATAEAYALAAASLASDRAGLADRRRHQRQRMDDAWAAAGRFLASRIEGLA